MFWGGQQRQCRGFLPIAEVTLELLGQFCMEDEARKALLGSNVKRCAALVKLCRVGTKSGLEQCLSPLRTSGASTPLDSLKG